MSRVRGFADRIEARAAVHDCMDAGGRATHGAVAEGRAVCGFTVVELVIIIMIVGILAVVVVPRFFELDAFRARGFYDEALSVLRYAQKTAVAQRRAVWVNLDATNEQVALCYANTFPCSTPANQVPDPYGSTPYVVTAASGVDLTSATTFFFDALGRPYNAADTVPTSTFSTLTISISGGGDTRAITVERETGYVR